MTVTKEEWNKYISALNKLNKKASDEFVKWLASRGGIAAVDRQLLIDYAYALITKYGEGGAALAAEFYDEIAKASGKILPAAIPADIMTYGEVAKAINGTIKFSLDDDFLGGTIERCTKQAAADTTLRNARRDHAEYAWIPSGDTCIFCMTLASNGWQYASQGTADGAHADHIHKNCDCEFAIRFVKDTEYEGYNPSKYREIYDTAPGITPEEKINYLRREQYTRDKERINEQKRIAYASRKERENA